jgi:hypothetical protein
MRFISATTIAALTAVLCRLALQAIEPGYPLMTDSGKKVSFVFLFYVV